MPLHVTVIPASTQAGNQTIRTLLHSMNKPIVHGIYRNPEKAPKEFTENANFHISQGDAYAGLGLDFGRSDAVFYVPPPPLDGTETGVFAKTAAEYIKEAIQKAPNVKKLVLFSSMGAQYDNSIVSANATMKYVHLHLARASCALTTSPIPFSRMLLHRL